MGSAAFIRRILFHDYDASVTNLLNGEESKGEKILVPQTYKNLVGEPVWTKS